jgi:hypothetical protein
MWPNGTPVADALCPCVNKHTSIDEITASENGTQILTIALFLLFFCVNKHTSIDEITASENSKLGFK